MIHGRGLGIWKFSYAEIFWPFVQIAALAVYEMYLLCAINRRTSKLFYERRNTCLSTLNDGLPSPCEVKRPCTRTALTATYDPVEPWNWWFCLSNLQPVVIPAFFHRPRREIYDS